MEDPEVVPEKLRNPINYKIIALIIGLGIAAYIGLNSIDDEELIASIATPPSIGMALAVAITSFIVAKRYSGTLVFGKAYLALGLAYLSYTIAEILYYVLDGLGMETYPSIADVFFFALYPLSLIHLIVNIRFFNPKFTAAHKIWIPLLPIVFISAYTILSFEELTLENIDSFDFYYGIIFLAAASVTLSIASIGASIFRQGVIGIAWLLLVIGILVNALADLWYYHEELYGLYHDAHPLTVIWWVSNGIMIYALYKHQKIM